MRTKNVILSGYPKSGTFWVTQLLAELLQAPAKGYWGHKGESMVTEGLERESDD